MDLAVPTLSDATYPGLDVNEDLSPREWSREKQAYHTSSLGITGLQNSYLVQRSTRHQLIVGLLDVSLQSFFLASHYFPEKTQLITSRDYQGAVSLPMCIKVCRGTFLQVLGTPTREEIQCMNPGYTDFRLPQIKAHPWHRVFHKRMPPEAIDLAS